MINSFYVSTTAAVVGLSAAYYYLGWEGVAITAILSVLEITLSFENAIVNAVVLKDMSEKWRQRFLTWGIVIAVFGMRLLFPILLVSCLTHLNPVEVLELAVEKPTEYSYYLHQAHSSISAFGGMFLLLVFLDFILDHKREIHWLGVIERRIAQLGNLRSIEVVIALLLLLVIQSYVPVAEKTTILISGISGLSIFVIVHSLAEYMNDYFHDKQIGSKVKQTGVMSFIYLEFLDASFSFDGVIGAFAITKDIVIIMLGLGIGAFFVRSLTIFLVHRKTLQKYIYLEHGAYFALGALSVMMLLNIFYPIPEVLIGTIGVVLIAFSYFSSVRVLRKR
jgi:hypothetical protein